jgi:hypothetical protein
MAEQTSGPTYCEVRMAKLTFTQARELLDGIPNINFGGCGIAALALVRWRKANGFKDAEIVYYEDDQYDFQRNERALESGTYDDMIAPVHVLLKIGSRWYDTEGEYSPPEDDDYLFHTIPIEALVTTINVAEWNDDFMRGIYTPIISELLHVDLSDIEL